MLSDFHKILKTKRRASRLMQEVARMKWHQEESGKWVNCVLLQRFFL
jgi:hypothetical protein